MKPSLHLIELSNIPILRQLQWEEALLRADERNWCLINRGSPPAIVMGISGQTDELICSETLNKNPIPIIRRFSGGGTVVVDENTLFITIICQSAALTIPPFPRSIMEWTAQLYHPFLKEKNFLVRENDYVFGSLKWGGNAQAIKKDRWLHHSSLLWNYDAKLMNYLKIPIRMPQYREARPHNDFLCKLSDYFDCPNLFKNLFINELANQFEMIETNMTEIIEKEKLPHRKMTKIEKKPLKGTGRHGSTLYV
jgi:lipoate---protein ligase